MDDMEFTQKYLSFMNERETEKLAAVSSDKDEQTKIELDLIGRVQKYNDPIALQKLSTMYRGTINNQVRASGILSVMSETNANQEALNIFSKLVQSYKVDDYLSGVAKAKPLTYITESLFRNLQKVNYANSGSGVRISDQLRGFNKTKYIAEQALEGQLNRKPTYEETYNYMRNELGVKNKDLSVANLQRIDHYKTTELSGSQFLGSGNAEGAEKLTLSDVTSVSDNIQDIYNRQMEERMVEEEINKFTTDTNKRKFLKMNFGVGEYKDNRARSINEASFNCGVTYYEANKLVSSFRQHISQKREV